MKRSRLIGLSLLATCCWLLGGGCNAGDGAAAGSNTTAGSSGGPGGGGGGSGGMMTAGTSGNGGGGKVTLDPLCGVADDAGECVPDNASACRDYVPPLGAGGASSPPAGAGGASDDAGGQNFGGQGGAPSAAPFSAGAPANEGGLDAGGPGGAASSGAGGEAGQGSQEPPELASYSCQVTTQNNLLTRQCVRAGAGKANAPCFGAADCAPSFACVTDGEAGRCLPYCCDQGTTCAPGTYCAEQPLRRAQSAVSNTSTPRVPVCVPADGCSLEDKYPCPSGDACRCPGDTACLVVRHDGTTACVKPGTGQQGDACPCAWNHICSSVTNQCVKICRIDSDSDCGTQKCQASAELPPNFGVCVGPLK